MMTAIYNDGYNTYVKIKVSMNLKKAKRPAPLSSMLVAGAVIMFWRGVWGLMDVYLFPNNLPLSYAISLIVSLLLFTFVVRHHIKKLT